MSLCKSAFIKKYVAILLSLFLFSPLAWSGEAEVQVDEEAQVLGEEGTNITPIDFSQLIGTYEFSFYKELDPSDEVEPQGLMVIDKDGNLFVYTPPKAPQSEMTCQGQTTYIKRTLSLQIKCPYTDYSYTYEMDLTDIVESDSLFEAPSSSKITLNETVVDKRDGFMKFKKTTFDPVAYIQSASEAGNPSQKGIAELTQQMLQEWEKAGDEAQPLTMADFVGTFDVVQQKEPSEEGEEGEKNSRILKMILQINEDGSVLFLPAKDKISVQNQDDKEEIQKRLSCESPEPLMLNNRVATLRLKCDYIKYIIAFHMNFNDIEPGDFFVTPSLVSLEDANGKVITPTTELEVESLQFTKTLPLKSHTETESQ